MEPPENVTMSPAGTATLSLHVPVIEIVVGVPGVTDVSAAVISPLLVELEQSKALAALTDTRSTIVTNDAKTEIVCDGFIHALPEASLILKEST